MLLFTMNITLSIAWSQSSKSYINLIFSLLLSSLSWIITSCSSLSCFLILLKVYWPSPWVVLFFYVSVGWLFAGFSSWHYIFLAEDIVKGTLGLGISFTYGLFSTTFPLPFVLEPVGVDSTKFSPVTRVYFLKYSSETLFFIYLISWYSCAMTKWAFLNFSLKSMIILSLSSDRVGSMMAYWASLGSCDVCMKTILFYADLLSGLLGVSTTFWEK